MTSQAIKQDAYDQMVYGQAIQDLPDLRALDKRSAAASDVLRDVHAALYKIRPTIEEDAAVPHREVIEQLMDTTEYARLRATTRMSEIGSAFGALELGQTLIDHLPEDPPEQDGDEQQEGQPGPGQVMVDGCSDRDEQRRALRRMVAEAQERTEEGVEAAKSLMGSGGWSGTGDGQGEQMSLADAVALSKRLRDDPRLRKIAHLAGRMRRLASGKRETRLRHGPDDVVGVELGNDLSRLLPSELQALVTPELETLAMLRYSQRRMLQVKREGKQRVAQGPIVVLVDESASMSLGERDTWAKALALGVLSIAQKEKRSFAVGTFNARCTLRSWGRSPDMNTVLDFLSRRPRGGTNFSKPLNEAMALIEQEKNGNDWSKADVILITDGEDYEFPPAGFIERWKVRAEKTGAHLYVIYIGVEGHSLDSISDGTAYVRSLDDDSTAIDLAFGI